MFLLVACNASSATILIALKNFEFYLSVNVNAWETLS